MKNFILGILLIFVCISAFADNDDQAGEQEAHAFYVKNQLLFTSVFPTTLVTYTKCIGYLDCK